jgi:hypothetical protein
MLSPSLGSYDQVISLPLDPLKDASCEVVLSMDD